MATLSYPIHVVIDDAGAIVSGATVTVASVTDKAGTPIASHGATVSLAGANVCVDYDAETKGDAWVTLAVSKSGSTFTGLNAAPRAFLTRDPQQLDARVSTRSTYAGTDTAGTTTLLSRLPQAMLFTGSGEAKADFWRAGAQVAASDPATDATLTAAAVWATSSRTVTGGTIATLTGHTPQTGDTYARIGATGSGLTSLAQSAQIPANFTSSLFASSGVFASGALANAPTGGSGSADFTADQRTSLLTALGVPSSGTTLVVPTSGVLKAINDKTTNLPASPAAVGSAMTVSDKAGFRLAANGLDAIAVEAGVNARQALAPILAAAAGAVTGAGTGTIAIRGANSTVTRITAATDNAGNRTSVALSLPA